MIKKIIVDYLNRGGERTSNLKKNIVSTFFIKGISIITSLLIVPISINYVDAEQYGIWLTLSSVVGWLSFFDIGFGNGFRNKFAIALANNDLKLAKEYVSTIYKYLIIIFGSVWLLFIFINYFIDWNELLNINQNIKSLSVVAIIIFSYFCIHFVLKIIDKILLADQKPALTALINTLSQIVSLLIIYILTIFTEGSLLKLSLALTIAPVITLFIASIILFKKKYYQVSPSYKLAKRTHAKAILTIGLKFFAIQIASIIQYQTTNFLISRFFTQVDVTAYNISFKYFSILNMIFLITKTPFWSACTEAYAKNDIKWITKLVNKYTIIWLGLLMVGIFMLIFSNYFYDIWIGKDKIEISFKMSFWTFCFILSSMFSGIFISVINGIGALRIQYILAFITPFIFIGLSILFIKSFDFGVESIIIASIIANITGIIIAPIQYKMIIKRKNGIWIK